MWTRLVKAVNSTVNSLVVLAMSWQRDRDSSSGFSAKAYGWSSCCVSENSLCCQCWQLTWRWYDCKSRCPVDHYRAKEWRPPWHICPCCWLGSGSRRSADRRLFVFVYLLSGSLNFSTRQLNPYRATCFKCIGSPALCRPLWHSGSEKGG